MKQRQTYLKKTFLVHSVKLFVWAVCRSVRQSIHLAFASSWKILVKYFIDMIKSELIDMIKSELACQKERCAGAVIFQNRTFKSCSVGNKVTERFNLLDNVGQGNLWRTTFTKWFHLLDNAGQGNLWRTTFTKRFHLLDNVGQGNLWRTTCTFRSEDFSKKVKSIWEIAFTRHAR